MRIECRTQPEVLPDLGPISPLLTRLYAARGVTDASTLDKHLAALLPFQGLKNIDGAVDMLVRALGEQQPMLVMGDFDADGATATAVAVLGLRALGAGWVDYLVPNRFTYGYGLSPEIVEVALGRQPQLLITVDNGISSLAGVAAAKAAGLQVLITDHHLPGPELPAADVILNPNQPGCGFASKSLAGVGVMFYLLLALRARLRQEGWFSQGGRQEPRLAELLDLVALGTVADLVPLDANNRILVHQGLARIRAGYARPGLKALFEVAGRSWQRASAGDLGFMIGPRLNAAGRLEDMSLGIACLLAEDDASAQAMASHLDQLNRERQQIERGMQKDAQAQLDKLPDTDMPFGICLFDPDWHQGVIGILAARIKDRYHRPAIAFSDAGDGWLKGSARSVTGVHIRDLLAGLATANPRLIEKFGGHAMAAGLTIHKDRLAEFASAFDAQVREQLGADQLDGVLVTDGELQDSEFDLNLAKALRLAGPWGQQFPEPLFHGRFRVLGQRLLAERHLKLSVMTERGTVPLDAIAFNVDTQHWPNPDLQWVRLVYQLDVNQYRDRERLQLLVSHIEPA